MGERSRGKDKGKLERSPKAARPGKRPHEQSAPKLDVLRRPM